MRLYSSHILLGLECPKSRRARPRRFWEAPPSYPKIERIYREVRVVAIGGGSEEIMLDPAGRQLGYG
jgi:alkylation response protein AidB-like acyl-CoA dehydrogenase